MRRIKEQPVIKGYFCHDEHSVFLWTADFMPLVISHCGMVRLQNEKNPKLLGHAGLDVLLHQGIDRRGQFGLYQSTVSCGLLFRWYAAWSGDWRHQAHYVRRSYYRAVLGIYGYRISLHSCANSLLYPQSRRRILQDSNFF